MRFRYRTVKIFLNVFINAGRLLLNCLGLESWNDGGREVGKFAEVNPAEIIAISTGRQTVLTTENEMPRPYQNIASVVEGDQGFTNLRKLLRKAGLEIE